MFHRQHFDHRLDNIDHRLEMLEAYLIIRDPGTAKSAEAYDGLRKLLINANKGRQMHLAHLAELHRVASAADSLEPVLAKMREFMNQVGLAAVNDAAREELFEFTGGTGPVAVVDSPAYIVTNGSEEVPIVMRGAAHHEELPTPIAMPPGPSQESAAEAETVTVDDSPVEVSRPAEEGEAS